METTRPTRVIVSKQIDPEKIPNKELLLVDRTEQLTYESVTNYARAAKGSTQICVMCGNLASHSRGGGDQCGDDDQPPGTTIIPRQNKDVCRDCDKVIWNHETSNAYFKWCKGCKNFLQIGTFPKKLDAAKCDKCRERGRTSYLLKKRTTPSKAESTISTRVSANNKNTKKKPVRIEKEVLLEEKKQISDDAAAISLVSLFKTAENIPSKNNSDTKSKVGALSQSFGCSLAKTALDENPPHDDDSTGESVPPRGLLFELANIHATILKLEQEADKVPLLENQVNDLKIQLSAALDREELLKARLAALESTSDSEEKPKKRPRLISFDDAANSSHY